MPSPSGYGADTVTDGTPAADAALAPHPSVLVPTQAPPAQDETSTSHVTAVLVAHDGSRWLPAALQALAAQTRSPDRVVAVDTGSSDDSVALLTGALGAGAVVRADRELGFGAAVQIGLGAAGAPAAEGFVWLLHDDAAPAPDALERLLAYAETDPSAAVLGPKVADWDDPDRLVEVGLTVDVAGNRLVGVQTGERDRGQRDRVHDVLAVGTACALVRACAWHDLGGLDPQLPAFRDDVDLGIRACLADLRVVVVPAAVVRHASASLTGLRRPVAAGRSPRRLDRRAALYTRLANARLVALPFLLLAAPVLALGRAASLALRRRPVAAYDELAAAAAVLSSPHRLWRGRRFRRGTRRLPARALRPLLWRRRDGLRVALTGVAARLVPGRTDRPVGAPAAPLPAGGLGRLLARPLAPLAVVASAVGVVGARSLLGGGTAVGGRLLPAPGGASSLWAAYAAGWHPTGGLGSGAPAPPWTALLAALSTVLGGKPWLAVDVVLVGAVPFAVLAAYAGSRGLGLPRTVRLAAAAGYGLLPAVTGSVATGRVDVLLALVALPLVLAAGGRLLAGPGFSGWSRAVRVGLGLTVLAACVPAYALAGCGLLVGGALAVRRWRRAPLVVAALAVPALLLLPTLHVIVRRPAVLVAGWGAGPAPSGPDPLRLVLLVPGGAGMPPPWLLAPLVLAGLAGLLRSDVVARRRVAACWAVALTGYVGALVLSRLTVGGVRGWPGPALALAGAGILGAAAFGAAGAPARLRARSFGWRQPLAVVLAVCAVAAPVALAAVVAVRGDTGALRRSPGSLASGVGGARVLVLRSSGGVVRWALDRSTLGDSDDPVPPGAARFADAVVRAATGGRGVQAGRLLAAAAVDQVVVPAADAGPTPPSSARAGDDLLGAVAGTAGAVGATVRGGGGPGLLPALDADPSLTPEAPVGGLLRWRPVPAGSRLSVLAPAAASAAVGPLDPQPAGPLPSTGTAVPMGTTSARAHLAAGPAGRLLVLAEPLDSRWRATVDGRPLARRTAWGWAQAFALPTGGGDLTLRYDQRRRHRVVAAQGVAALVLLLLALPPGRRTDPLR